MELYYTDGLALLCTIFGLAVFLTNMRYARDGLAKSLRVYLGMKGVVALFVAMMYGATVLNIMPDPPPPALSRSLMALLLFLMFLDTVVRDADANRTLKVMAAKLMMQEPTPQEQPPQINAEVKKDA